MQAGGLQSEVAKGEFLFLNGEVMEKVTAHAAPCQNSRALPSSVQIFQEIMVREPRGKGRSSAAGTTLKIASTESLPGTKLYQSKNAAANDLKRTRNLPGEV